MTREEFTPGLRRLRLAMGHGQITTDQRDVLFDLCSYIPASAWGAIVEEAIKIWDTWPRNFSKAVRDLWLTWLSRNPQAQAVSEKSDCAHCWASSGYIWARQWQDDLGYYSTAVFRCGHCANSEGNVGVPRKTVDEIRSMDHEIETAPEAGKAEFVPFSKVKELAAASVKPMPEPIGAAELERRQQEQNRRLDEWLESET